MSNRMFGADVGVERVIFSHKGTRKEDLLEAIRDQVKDLPPRQLEYTDTEIIQYFGIKEKRCQQKKRSSEDIVPSGKCMKIARFSSEDTKIVRFSSEDELPASITNNVDDARDIALDGKDEVTATMARQNVALDSIITVDPSKTHGASMAKTVYLLKLLCCLLVIGVMAWSEVKLKVTPLNV